MNLDKSGFGELTVLDQDGKVAQTITRHDFVEGVNVVNFDPDVLAPGEYTMRLNHLGTNYDEPFAVTSAKRNEVLRNRQMRTGEIRVDERMKQQ